MNGVRVVSYPHISYVSIKIRSTFVKRTDDAKNEIFRVPLSLLLFYPHHKIAIVLAIVQFINYCLNF